MVSAPIPQDILKYESKPIFGLSMRQAVCLAVAGGLVAFMYLIVMPELGYTDDFDQLRLLGSAIPAVLPIIFGWLKPFGQPIEKAIIPLIQDNLIYPVKRKNEIHFPEYEKDKKKMWAKPNKKANEAPLKASKIYKSIK